MGRRFINELKEGDMVDDVFLLQGREVKIDRNNKSYIQAKLADKSGTIAAKVWDVSSSQIESFGKEGPLRVKGVVGLYNNSLQLTIKDFSREDSYDRLEELFPCSERDVKELKEELVEIIGTIGHPHLARLLRLFLADEEFMQRLSLSPASVKYHHAYLGGLLEHTVSIARLAIEAARHYSVLNRDLLLTGAILHDIGKTRELSYKGGFQYTDEGGLVGHIVMGALMVEEKAVQIKDFPGELLDLVKHIILGHHGDTDPNSPRIPATAEALAVHYLDNLDAKLQAFARAVAEDRDPHSNWTEFQKIFDSRLYKGTQRYSSSP